MNKRQHKKLVDRIRKARLRLEHHVFNCDDEGMLLMWIIGSTTHEVAGFFKCRKSQARMIQRVASCCAIVVEPSWDGSMCDWLLFPTEEHVVRKTTDSIIMYLNEDGSNNPYDWEERIVQRMSPVEYQNYRDSVFLV